MVMPAVMLKGGIEYLMCPILPIVLIDQRRECGTSVVIGGFRNVRAYALHFKLLAARRVPHCHRWGK